MNYMKCGMSAIHHTQVRGDICDRSIGDASSSRVYERDDFRYARHVVLKLRNNERRRGCIINIYLLRFYFIDMCWCCLDYYRRVVVAADHTV